MKHYNIAIMCYNPPSIRVFSKDFDDEADVEEALKATGDFNESDPYIMYTEERISVEVV